MNEWNNKKKDKNTCKFDLTSQFLNYIPCFKYCAFLGMLTWFITVKSQVDNLLHSKAQWEHHYLLNENNKSSKLGVKAKQHGSAKEKQSTVAMERICCALSLFLSPPSFQDTESSDVTWPFQNLPPQSTGLYWKHRMTLWPAIWQVNTLWFKS